MFERHVSALLRAVALSAILFGSSQLWNGGQTVALSATPPPPPKARQGPFAVVLVVDAARADEFNLNLMPNLAALAARGTMYSDAWVGQLPSVTEASHATIGTGVLPRRHLILGDTWRIPGHNQMSPDLLDSQLTRTGYIGKILQQSHAPTLAGLVHQRYPGSLVATMSGHKIYAADAMGAGAADFVAFGSKDSRAHFIPSAIPGRVPAVKLMRDPQLDLSAYPRAPGLEDHWTTTLALKFLFKYHPRLLLVNFPEVDTTGHLAGTDAAVMQPLMSDVDREVGRIVAAYRRAGMLPQTTFVVTADHGMVPAAHTVGIDTIKRIVAQAGGNPLYIGHGDDSAVWLKNLDAVPRVAAALSQANMPDVAAIFAKDPAGHYRLVSPQSRLADPAVQQSYLDLLNTMNQMESPDIVLLYDENTMTMTPSFLKIGRKGDHGGATWGAQHIPFIVAGPNIKPGFVSRYPARLADIAPTLETVLGASPRGQDGVPLADSMLRPPAWASQAQAKVAPRLTADVRYLETEASLRPNLK